METLTLSTVTFENCFGTERTKSKVEAIIRDNRQFIADFDGSIFDYLWNDITWLDQGEYEWMKDECAEFYSELSDSADKAIVTGLLRDFLKANYEHKEGVVEKE